MRIGLIGLPGSGKTTVFNALTRSGAPVSGQGCKAEPNMAVVKVMDERVDRLTELYEPKKTVYATVEFVDFAGARDAGGTGEGLFPGAALATMRTMDALALVVRNFDDGLSGGPSVLADIRRVEEEMLLVDLILAENRIERIEKGYMRGQRTESTLKEEKTLRAIIERLHRNTPVRGAHLSPAEEKIIRGFQFLTAKPLMIVVNSEEGRFQKDRPLMEALEEGYRAVEFAGQFEMELGRLDEEEARLFMEDMGIRESAYRRLTKLSYDTLGYISFFTVGSDEVRAWNVRKGDTALDAAATIHTDLARGFIRAECFTYSDCLQCGSEKKIKARGLFRLEGREYQVQDGDILSIRFNV